MPKDGCSVPFSVAGKSRAGQPHNALDERARLQSNDCHRNAVPEKRPKRRRALADTAGVLELVECVRGHVGEHISARARPRAVWELRSPSKLLVDDACRRDRRNRAEERAGLAGV